MDPLSHQRFTKTIWACCMIAGLALIILLILAIPIFIPASYTLIASNELKSVSNQPDKAASEIHADNLLWMAPDSTAVPLTEEGDLIRYGKELISHTSKYLGPKGIVAQMSNGMNCQNCHLKSGTKPFGNNYSAVASTYPKFRARSGSIETIEKRINDCIQRSLNGKPLDDNSKEMKAIRAYMHWLGQSVGKGETPKGAGLVELTMLDRPANAENGKRIYQEKCTVCHGANGEGLKWEDGIEWKYPPLWGENSYNVGAGLYRLSRFAAYVKANMPYGASFDNSQLTDEEAWDLAAFVNSMPRPLKDLSQDWPDIAGKPFDHPFGPYADTFSEQQHKYGPFGPIREAKKR